MFRILVVDDDPSAQNVLKEVTIVFRHRYELCFARDGMDALDFLSGRGPYKRAVRPDLILLDMNMPRMDGIETLAAIKGDPELRVIPVIMLSSEGSPAVVRRSYECHANGYVLKPLDLEQTRMLMEAIEAFWMDFALSPLAATLPSFRTSRSMTTKTAHAPQNAAAAAAANSACDRMALGSVNASARKFEGDLVAEVVKSRYSGCDEHRRLLDEFGAAVREVLALHEQQFRGIVEGDAEANRYDLLIHVANERKQRAKYDYMRHMEAHGCSEE